jgi:hypothetical protein
MAVMENRSDGIQRSRRNLIKMGTIAASAVLAFSMKPAHADDEDSEGHEHSHNTGRGRDFHCFLRGTTIRTADDDKKIEDLAVGDLLPTVFGGLRPIQWIGRYRFKKSDPTKAWPKDVLPIRIARSALGTGMPHTDLVVTKAHALLIDDVLVPICNLINGTTIALYDARSLDELELFHIKLEHHDVIWAEGAPCETLLELDENAVNFAEYLREHGPPISKTIPCAPRLGFDDQVEIKSRFRSAISPWIDRRQKLDTIRDNLEEGETALLRLPEFVP